MRQIFKTIGSMVALASLCWHGIGHAAQDYPSRPITLVVPYTAGGTLDILARLVGELLGKELNARVVVENKPGAGGTVGGQIVSNAAPDGYTLLVSSAGPMSIAPAMYAKTMRTHPSDVLAPVASLVASQFVLTTSAKYEGKSMADLIRTLKDAPGKYNYASTGNGTIVHLFGEQFKAETETDFTHVPYPGGSQAVLAMQQGDILFSIINIPTVIEKIKAGDLKALATTGESRLPALPDTPTLQEQQLAGFERGSWIGVFAPKATPLEIREKLNVALSKAIKDPSLTDRLKAQGDVVQALSVAEFEHFVQESNDTWKRVANELNISLD